MMNYSFLHGLPSIGHNTPSSGQVAPVDLSQREPRNRYSAGHIGNRLLSGLSGYVEEMSCARIVRTLQIAVALQIIEQIDKIEIVKLEPFWDSRDRTAAAARQRLGHLALQFGVEDFTDADHRKSRVDIRSEHTLLTVDMAVSAMQTALYIEYRSHGRDARPQGDPHATNTAPQCQFRDFFAVPWPPALR